MATGMLSDAAVAERRIYRRVPLVCDVWQRGQRRIPAPAMLGRMGGLAGRTLNVSDGGALVQLTSLPDAAVSHPSVGQRIELTLALPRSTADTFLLEHVQVEAEVIRVVSHGEGQPPTRFAIRFGQPLPLQLD